MPILVVIGPQIKEKQGGGGTLCPSAYMVPKDTSLNLVTELGMLGAGFITFHKLF